MSASGGGRRVGSEAELIQGYLAPLAAGFAGAFGLGDDCALITPSPGEDLVITTDAVAEGVHFLPGDAPEDVAWKAVAVNVSDLVAKGARPSLYLMSLAFPAAPETAWLERFAAGLAAAQARFGITLAGGDSDRRPGPLAITITAIGRIEAGRMVKRSTARAGDRLFVSGTLGDAAAGLALRRDPGLSARWGLDAAQAGTLVKRYLRPEPRLELAPALVACASAAMDISDGLAKDAGRLAQASGLRAVLAAADLPLSEPFRRALAADPACLGHALAGGDDYETLAAVPLDQIRAFLAAAEAAGVRVSEIGGLEEGTGVTITGFDGHPIPLEMPGWDHF